MNQHNDFPYCIKCIVRDTEKENELCQYCTEGHFFKEDDEKEED